MTHELNNIEENEQRKEKSEQIILSKGLKINRYLPCIESSEQAKIRDIKVVALRTLCLIIVAVKAEGLEQEIIDELIDIYKLREHFTANETIFINSSDISEHDKIQNIWRYESAWTLLWALGYVESLGTPDNICDAGYACSIMKERTLEEFIAESELRSTDEILDQSDLIYRYDWAVVNARLQGQKLQQVDSSVVYERHYALNWLTHYCDQEWDDISTDT